MDLKEVAQLIAVAAGAGTFLYGFINVIWPKILHLGSSLWNWFMLRKIKEGLDKTDGMECFSNLDSCKRIVKRCETHKLNKQLDTALHLIETLRIQSRHTVRFFVLSESLNRERCASLLLAQNSIQSLFQFELGYVSEYSLSAIFEKEQDASIIEKKLCSIDSNINPGKFIEECESIISEHEITKGQHLKNAPIRIIITQAELPHQFYLWGHFKGPAKWNNPPKDNWGKYEPNKFWIISTASLKKVLPKIEAERFLLRVVQRACVLSLIPARRKNFAHRLSHYPTYGCLFDFTVRIADAQYYANRGFICEDCSGNILKAEEIPFGYRGEFCMQFRNGLMILQ